MTGILKQVLKLVLRIVDILIGPFVILGSCLFYLIRKSGIDKFRVSKTIFNKIGVFPIINHYYEPLFRTSKLNPLDKDRNIPGIDFNEDEQLSVLESFNFGEELEQLPLEKGDKISFYYHNRAFESGDAEYYYNIIRSYKPKKIIEIGSGFSTLMALEAIGKNKQLDTNYKCELVCVEPYEHNWLEAQRCKVIRDLVERIDLTLFKGLGKNDILFIDSSHMIRPQGDVLRELLEIVPSLNSGVIIHFHDIFTPKDYLEDWIKNKNYFWNEQYLLEAFLSFNREFKIIGALNFLKHRHFNKLSLKCPILAKESHREPGSMWIRKI
jgi:predicted O-methyltransferase YrrM